MGTPSEGLKEKLMVMVDKWVDQYLIDIQTKGPIEEPWRGLLKTAFRSGCLTTITEFAKQEVAVLLERYVKSGIVKVQ